MNHLSDELLNEYLDNALADRAQAEQHLAGCADCTARLAALQALFAEVESLPEVSLSRDLAAAVTRSVRGAGLIPRWLTLTVALQAAVVLIAVTVGAPFVLEFVPSSLPALQAPSLTGTVMQVQSQWVAWLDLLSQVELPAMPQIPVAEVSSLYFLLTLAGVSMFWLVGNGLLLRNQIK